MNDWSGIVRRAGVLLVAAAWLLLAVSPARAWVQCPPGQISLDGSNCITPQAAPYVPSGIGAQQSVLPQAGPNGAPALRSCNGMPTPIGQPCPGDPQPQAAAKTSSQPAISVSLAPAGIGPIEGPVTQATVSLQSLLGDWYTGWMSYLGSALKWSDSNTAFVASNFGTIPACLQGQQTSCEQAIWQQILPWYLILSPGAAVSVTTPAPPPQSATAAASTSAATSPAPPAAAGAAPTAQGSPVAGLLGDWYTGWLSYAAASLNWSDAQTAAADAFFAGAAPCAAGQQSACQAFVMQQLTVWLAGAPSVPDDQPPTS